MREQGFTEEEMAGIVALARLGRGVMERHREDGADLDGGDVQEMAVRCGVTRVVRSPIPCAPLDANGHTACACYEYAAGDDDEGDCYRDTPAVVAARAALAREDGS